MARLARFHKGADEGAVDSAPAGRLIRGRPMHARRRRSPLSCLAAPPERPDLSRNPGESGARLPEESDAHARYSRVRCTSSVRCSQVCAPISVPTRREREFAPCIQAVVQGRVGRLVDARRGRPATALENARTATRGKTPATPMTRQRHFSRPALGIGAPRPPRQPASREWQLLQRLARVLQRGPGAAPA